MSFELVEQSKDATLFAGQLALMGCQSSSAGTPSKELWMLALAKFDIAPCGRLATPWVSDQNLHFFVTTQVPGMDRAVD